MKTKPGIWGAILFLAFAAMTATTAWAAQRELAADGNGGYYINMPATGVDTLVIPDGVTTFNVLYDSDSRRTDGYLLLTAPEGKVLRLAGRIEGESCALLFVYDGVNDNAKNIINGYRIEQDVPRTLSSGRNLFINFDSPKCSNNLNLAITVVDPEGLHSVFVNEVENGTITASPIEANPGTEISLTVTPNEGYYLYQVTITDEYGNQQDVIGGKWYSTKTSFVMPNTDALITPYFYRAEGSALEMEMPATGTLFATIPDGAKGVRIDKRNSKENGFIVLSAPEGKVLKLSNSGHTRDLNDSLFVYDGNGTNSTNLWASITYGLNGLVSTGRYMTILFKSDESSSSSRGQIMVDVVDANENHNITVVNSEGGNVSASVNSASVNATVTLTATPDDGYILDYILVENTDRIRLDVNGDAWYESGSIFFKMPDLDVSVKPVFVHSDSTRSIIIPRMGALEVTLPEGLKSVKVYDDGGKDGPYSRIGNGSLLLHAPEGKRLYVTGSAKIHSSNSDGNLKIYERFNDGRNDKLLLNRSYNDENIKAITSGQSMLFDFKTSASTFEFLDGLDLTVTVDDPNGPHAIAFNSLYHGSINSSLSQAVAGTPIIITANPDDGYILDGVSVKDAFGNYLEVEGGKWYTGNTASFVMPQTDVTVSASFSELSERFDLDVTQSGTSSYVIPSGVKSIRLRIIGAQYEIMDNYVTLSVPEGYALLMRGYVYGQECEGSLYIYDGSSVGEKELLRTSGFSEFNSVASSGESVTLRYKENYNRSYSNTAVETYIEVVDLNATYNIVANENMYNGSFSSSHETANGNTLITLTAFPDPGYVLQGFYVRDENYNTVYVRGGEITNTATFVMPFSNVTITPQFTEVTDNYLTLSMPDTGRLVADIPEGIQKFMIDRCRGNRCDNSVLVLKAPEGRRVQLGPLWGHLLEKPLRVYDGADSNTTLLFSRTVDAEYENTSIDAPYGRYVSSGEYMTVVYEKDKNGYEESFNLPAVIVDPSEPHMIGVCNDNNNDYIDDCDWNGNNEDGVITSAVNSATVNTQVSLSAVPNEGKWLNRIRVKDRFGSIAVSGGTWYTSADATFTMPATDVWYEAYYATSLSVEGGLSIEKPRNEMLEVEIPDDVESFAINGVRDLSCSSTAPSEPLILNAPVGKIMRLENDYGYEYESDYSSFKVFHGKIENPVATNAATIDGNVSSGNVLTIIDYPSDERLIVRLQDVSDSPHKVTVVKKGNCEGSITAGDLDLDEIVVGTIVRMTVNPDEGCVLNDLYVAVGSEDSEMRIPIDGDSWAANGEFSFAMPFEDVYVVATIVDPNAEYAINIISYNANGTVVSNLSTAKAGDTVSLTITPNDGYSLAAVCVTYDDESCIDVTGGTWYNNDAQFTMPPMEVFVYANFAPEGYVSHTISIPKTGAENIEIPIGVNQFEIVSDATDCSGGYCSDYSYSDNSDGTLTLTASEGYGFSFYGWYQLADEGDFLEIFDGSDTNGVKLLNLPSTSGNWEYFDKVYTSGRSMTLRFKSNENWNAGGVEIDAYVEKLPDRVVEIPRSSSSTILLSDDVSVVNVFTEKNLDGRYYNNSDGMLTLSAPEGYAFYVYGPARANDDFDSLLIYDGSDANAKLIASISGGEYVYGIYSSGRNISFRFKSNEEGNDAGPQLEVYVLKKSGSGAVAIYEMDGSKMARIDGLYNGKDTVNIEEDVEVSYVEFVRDFAVTANDSGKYSTIVFPFDINANNIGGLDDILEFSQMIEEDGKLKVEMNRVWCLDGEPDRDCSSYEGNIKANTPYMLKTYSSGIWFNGGSITIKKTEPAVATSGNWQFIGTYAYKRWEKGNSELGSVYGYAAAASNGVEVGQFVKAGSGAYIRPLRAYLKYSASNGEPRPAPAGHVSAWRDGVNELPEEIEVVVVEGKGRAGIGPGESGSEKKTTVIGRINTRTGEFTPVTRTYDLKGRSLNAKPKAKGVYVGKKR